MIRCTACEETGKVNNNTCEMCDGGGMVEVGECPRKFVGQKLTKAINIASLCGNGVLPVSGGIMDQSAWFVSLWQQLQSDQAEIDAEITERWNNAG